MYLTRFFLKKMRSILIPDIEHFEIKDYKFWGQNLTLALDDPMIHILSLQ